jgi:acyl-CoA thioesterase-1
MLVACSSKTESVERRTAVTPSATPTPADQRPVIVAFGDSLTAGFGVEPGSSYPDFLQK